MKNLIETMTQAFDIVLVDTPPLSAVNGCENHQRLCCGVVVVARAYQTKKESLAKTKKMLDQVQANIIGVVLHGVNTSDTAYYYYYGVE